MIAHLLAAQARRTPDAVFLRTQDDGTTYRQALERSGRLAAGLASIGVLPGEPVVVLMGNSITQVVVWFAVNHLGAVHVPVNPALVGDGLAHPFRVTGARTAVVDADLLPRLDAVAAQLPDLQSVLVLGGTGLEPAPGGLTGKLLDLDLVGAQDLPPLPPAPYDELDPAVMLFTSGTTGVSKACVLSHRYVVSQGRFHAQSLALTGDDVLYSPFPLFHIDAATLTVVAALTVGGTAALGRGYSTSRFWDEVRGFGATVFNFMGATLTMLWKQPPSPRDREHRLRLGWGVPMPEWKAGFEERFGVVLYEVYGLTDAGVPVYDPLEGGHRPGACGRVIAPFELRIADQDGTALPAGRTGEILVRGREPGLTMTEYFGLPEATAHAYRGGWFHTQDLGRLDADGYLTFVGRSGDVIRRRGENISALEVEQAVETHPAVLEAAAIGVPSELTEEDVMVCVVPRPGAAVGAADLVAHLDGRLAAHMIPRYVRFVDHLPRTPTEKVEKFRLRDDAVGPGTWDRLLSG